MRLRTALDARRRATMVSLHTAGSALAEMAGDLDVDGVFIDMQHGTFDLPGVRQILAAQAGSDATPVVRVPWNDPKVITDVLDAGVGGVVCPLIESGEAAQAFVAACRYGAEGSGRDAADVTSLPLTIALIESGRGYENLDEIVATPGLDAIMVGSGDMTLSMDGVFKADESRPEVAARRDKMVSSAHARDLWVLASASVNPARNPFDNGADFLVVSDNSVLFPAVRAALTVLRQPRPTAVRSSVSISQTSEPSHG